MSYDCSSVKLKLLTNLELSVNNGKDILLSKNSV